MNQEQILEMLNQKLDEAIEDLLEARFKRVVRGGKLIRKRVARKGFKIMRSSGGQVKMKRMTPQEKRNRHRALMRAWKKGKASRVIRAKRKTKRSMLKRKAVLGK